MKIINQIKAYTMLLIMLSMMVHNAFPHVHHSHDIESTITTSGDSHSHGDYEGHQHHSDEDRQDHEQRNFLDFLFKYHSYTTHTHQYTPSTVEHVKSNKQLSYQVWGHINHWISEIREIDDVLHRDTLYENFISDHPYLPSYPHRGPPALG